MDKVFKIGRRVGDKLCVLSMQKGLNQNCGAGLAGVARVFLRGGNWNNGTNAGAFTLNLNWDTSNQNYNVGFRCARYSFKLWPDKNSQGDSSVPKMTTDLIPSFLLKAVRKKI